MRKTVQLGFAAVATLAAVSAYADWTSVPSANPKQPGIVQPNITSPELDLRLLASGAMKLDGATASTGYYGYINNNSSGTSVSAMVPILGTAALPSTPAVEASKTEPDKNTYLVLDPERGATQQTGADPNYPYGTHFLFQGHEVGDHGYITRINLDADGAHRVTLLADTLADGSVIPNIDGSTWDPFAGRLLFTGEEAATSGVLEGTVLQATLSHPSTVTKLDTVIGIAGWEGIQNDSAGNIWLVADQGGAFGTANPQARQPNSFIYRFVPTNPADLTRGGKLQALQVMKLDNSGPIVFHDGSQDPTVVDKDILSQDMKDLHTYGNHFHTRWVTVHDTDASGFGQFDANLAAKNAGATPFKRPENGVFRPSLFHRFGEFFFTETGDTNAQTQAGAAFGGFGAVFRLSQVGPGSDGGVLTMLVRGEVAHTGFDNLSFLTNRLLLVVEDAGDNLHMQRNALDSGYIFDVNADYSNGLQPIRFLAEGRDASATLDSATAKLSPNADNEITGIHVSDGDPSVNGILGNKLPLPFLAGWRIFWTQQHGDNNTWEIVPRR